MRTAPSEQEKVVAASSRSWRKLQLQETELDIARNNIVGRWGWQRLFAEENGRVALVDTPDTPCMHWCVRGATGAPRAPLTQIAVSRALARSKKELTDSRVVLAQAEARLHALACVVPACGARRRRRHGRSAASVAR